MERLNVLVWRGCLLVEIYVECSKVKGGGDPKVTHRCGGELLVRIFLKLFICRVLSHFTFDLEKDQDLEVDWGDFSQQPKDGAKITICRKF